MVRGEVLYVPERTYACTRTFAARFEGSPARRGKSVIRSAVIYQGGWVVLTVSAAHSWDVQSQSSERSAVHAMLSFIHLINMKAGCYIIATQHTHQMFLLHILLLWWRRCPVTRPVTRAYCSNLPKCAVQLLLCVTMLKKTNNFRQKILPWRYIFKLFQQIM